MFPIAGQTARPIGLNFLWTLMGVWGVSKVSKKFEIKKKLFHHFFLQNFFFQKKFSSRPTPGLSASDT